VSQGAPDANAQAAAAIRKPIDQLREKAYSMFTPTGHVPPEQLEATRRAANITTGVVGAAAALPAVAGAFAPTVGAETVGTGILDAGGTEITKDVATMGPSFARATANGVLQMIKGHPIISTYVGTHLANALGIPLPKVLKAMAGIKEIAP
jgi:hypothetical protein